MTIDDIAARHDLAPTVVPERAMIVTYKYRLKDRSAAKRLAQMAIAANQIWNYCNAVQRDIEARYRAGAPSRRWPTHFTLCKLTSGTSGHFGISAQTINAICSVYASRRDKNHGSLKFRSSFGSRRSLGWIPFVRKGCQTEGNSVTYLGRTYKWFGNKRRPLPPEAGGGAFAEDTQGRWWICFEVEVQAKAMGFAKVGIDLGLKTLATLSDGTKIDNIRPLRQWAEKLAVAQRAGNKRRTVAIYAKIANVRKDHLHKITTSLARSNALIAVGNVNSKKLAKTKMAKSVLDAGWSTFRQMLAYKSAGYVEVDESFTTRTCSGCGSIAGPKGYAGLNKRDWDCPHCGESHDRDVNSARVILARALSAQGHADESRMTAMGGSRISTTAALADLALAQSPEDGKQEKV